MWDERYGSDGYAYGTEPNDYLRAVAPRLPLGDTLCLGEGEGRNAVFLAGLGHRVTAVDGSLVGLRKAQWLAEETGVALRTIHSDFSDYVLEPAAWDCIVSIFVHLPAPLRRRLHQQAVGGLRPGGVFVLEAYTPRQLALGTGGPPAVEMMMDLDLLSVDLAGLRLLHAAELDREVHEGRYHNGTGAVVQILATKD
jgi:SAM-dependent methyltransferase